MADANFKYLIQYYREVEDDARAARRKALRAAQRVTLLALLAVSIMIYYLLSTLHQALLT